MRHVGRFGISCLKIAGKFLALLVGIVVLLGVGYNYPNVIVDVLDWNLQALKWACGFLPAPWGQVTEAVLRMTFALEKGILLLESVGLVKGVSFVIWKLALR